MDNWYRDDFRDLMWKAECRELTRALHRDNAKDLVLVQVVASAWPFDTHPLQVWVRDSERGFYPCAASRLMNPVCLSAAKRALLMVA